MHIDKAISYFLAQLQAFDNGQSTPDHACTSYESEIDNCKYCIIVIQQTRMHMYTQTSA